MRTQEKACPTILVVEDEPEARLLLRMFPEPQGYRVIETHCGDAAISLAQAHRPQVMLLDVLLSGGLNGVQVYHRLKGKSSTRQIPIIFLTATAPSGSVSTPQLPLGERCVVLGKPFDWHRLHEEIQQLLRRSSPTVFSVPASSHVERDPTTGEFR